MKLIEMADFYGKLLNMNVEINKCMSLTKRGLLSADEAERKINQLIDETLPTTGYDSLDHFNEAMEIRRKTNRRKWQFLLRETKKENDIR